MELVLLKIVPLCRVLLCRVLSAAAAAGDQHVQYDPTHWNVTGSRSCGELTGTEAALECGCSKLLFASHALVLGAQVELHRVLPLLETKTVGKTARLDLK